MISFSSDSAVIGDGEQVLKIDARAASAKSKARFMGAAPAVNFIGAKPLGSNNGVILHVIILILPKYAY